MRTAGGGRPPPPPPLLAAGLLLLLAVGCDGVVGSARRPDACGVCGGDNSTCRLVSGLFTRPSLPRVGYHLIATLPRGACNVSVTELKHSRNFLALRRQDGSYVINGNWGISWSGEYEAAGTRVTYRRQDAGLLETVTAPGPLTEPLDIMVLYQQPNPGIKYEYTLPMKPSDAAAGAGAAAPADADHHAPVWLASEWSHQCSAPCGTGVQARRVLCWPGPDESACDSASRPTESRACASDKQCPGQWFTGPWGQCSARCGRGRQTRATACIAIQRGILRVVPDGSCAVLMRPEHERSCVGHDCGPDWFAAEWTTCSRDCGGGIQRRDVRCLDQHQRPSSDCSDERRPATKRTCNTHECGTSQNGNGSGTTENRLKDDPIPSRDSGDQAISTDEKSVHDDECVDKIANCHLVVQARLCTLSKLYRTSCCHSCHKKL